MTVLSRPPAYPGRRQSHPDQRLGGLCADVRQALREVGCDGLADALDDVEIIDVLRAQERLLAKALARGYVDHVELGGVHIDAASGQDERHAYLVQAARDRLAFGRGWLADGLTPPWRHPDEPATATAMAGDAAWLERLLLDDGTPDGWTSQDSLRWLASERGRVARQQAAASDAGRADRLGWVGALLAEAERRAVQQHHARPRRPGKPGQPAGNPRHNRKRGHDAP